MRSKDLARIVHDDESLYLSARSPYDRETLFEEIRWYASRYGCVQLELGDHVFNVEGRAATATSCAACGGALVAPTFREGDDPPVCARCAGPKVFPRVAGLSTPSADARGVA